MEHPFNAPVLGLALDMRAAASWICAPRGTSVHDARLAWFHTVRGGGQPVWLVG